VPLAYELVTGDGKSKPKRKKFARHDQFGAQLEYFSDCILKDRNPEPFGVEGLADIRVVRAILESASRRKPVQLPPLERHARPSKRQEFKKPAVQKPEVVHASSPSERYPPACSLSFPKLLNSDIHQLRRALRPVPALHLELLAPALVVRNEEFVHLIEDHFVHILQ
jgi:hypothetical protein